MSTRIRNFFSSNIFLRMRKFSRPHATYSNRFQPSTRIQLYPEIFWFAIVPSSFAGENPEMSMRIIPIQAPFLSRHSYCEVWTVEACSLSLEKCLNLLKKSRKSMLIHINGPMMTLKYCWRSRRKYKTNKIQNEANRQKHRLEILCWQVWRDLETYSAHYPTQFSTQEEWVNVRSQLFC